jgi:hypothetical protein
MAKSNGAAKNVLNQYVKKTSIGGNKNRLKKSSMNKQTKRMKGLQK